MKRWVIAWEVWLVVVVDWLFSVPLGRLWLFVIVDWLLYDLWSCGCRVVIRVIVWYSMLVGVVNGTFCGRFWEIIWKG